MPLLSTLFAKGMSQRLSAPHFPSTRTVFSVLGVPVDDTPS